MMGLLSVLSKSRHDPSCHYCTQRGFDLFKGIYLENVNCKLLYFHHSDNMFAWIFSNIFQVLPCFAETVSAIELGPLSFKLIYELSFLRVEVCTAVFIIICGFTGSYLKSDVDGRTNPQFLRCRRLLRDSRTCKLELRHICTDTASRCSESLTPPCLKRGWPPPEKCIRRVVRLWCRPTDSRCHGGRCPSSRQRCPAVPCCSRRSAYAGLRGSRCPPGRSLLCGLPRL